MKLVDHKCQQTSRIMNRKAMRNGEGNNANRNRKSNNHQVLKCISMLQNMHYNSYFYKAQY